MIIYPRIIHDAIGKKLSLLQSESIVAPTSDSTTRKDKYFRYYVSDELYSRLENEEPEEIENMVLSSNDVSKWLNGKKIRKLTDYPIL